ncbi:MAG: acyltransferase [Deltaproteobacteria bacterium]|nr:acyltransferase [Deltaproteobacteria bacterium]
MQTSRPADRLPEIDMVKGIAILGVTLIHSTALGEGSLPMTLLFGHAVPIFLVLFGVNTEAWFERRNPSGRTRTWYERGIKRILVPTWGTLVVWWMLVLIFRPPTVRLTIGLPFYHALGYLKQVGTGWFITVIVQLVLLFPLFHWLARRIGIRWMVALCGAVTLATLIWMHVIRAELGLAGWMVLSPRFYLHIAFGMMLAPFVHRLDRATVLWSAVVYLILAVVGTRARFTAWATIANRLLELPLTILLLAAMRALSPLDPLRQSLSWLGRHSLGLYLGQMLTHNAFLFALGGRCTIYGCQGGLFDRFNLWVYTVVLFLGSVGFLALGHLALRIAESLRERGLPVPDLST